MKKIIISALLVLSLGVSVVGCTTNEKGSTHNGEVNDTHQEDNGSGNQGITFNKIDYKLLENPSDDLQEAIMTIEEVRGYGVIKETEDHYILYIGLGQKPTAGYEIQIQSIEDIEGITKIIVEETRPAKDQMVAEVLTYPMVLLQLDKNIAPNFKVVTTEGDTFQNIIPDPS